MSNSELTHQQLVQERIRKIIAFALVVLLLFALRLIDLQAVRASGYVDRAQNELTKSATLLAPRGTIYDVNGVELARSVSAINIAVDQMLINDPITAANLVAPILGMTSDQLLPQITGTKRYVIIAKDVTPAIWEKIYTVVSNYNKTVMAQKKGISKRISGFIPERSYIRDYPSGSLTASLIGIINDAGVGASGVESSLNPMLSGVNGEYRYANGRGSIIPGSQEVQVEAKSGTSIRLTIDQDVQWVAQNAINQAVSSSRAKSGTVIVMDPKTGHILAQASAPTFDPNSTKKITLDTLNNPAVQEVYEPGSTGKVITVAAALEEQKITPNTVFTVPYSMKIYDRTFSDHEKHPTEQMTTTKLLAVSSNTGSIKIGQLLGKDKLYNYLRKFGIGESTNSKIAGESAGILHPVKDWSGVSLPTISFGQGYSVTALQSTSVFATIANNGIKVNPTILAGVVDQSGRYTPAKKVEGVRVLSDETAAKMRLMMEGVVSKTGTAPTAAISGYRVAGKTGTAQRYNTACGCYSGYTATFIGFAPADAPKYVVSVTIQDPKGMHWGGVLAGPVFKKVMSFVLQNEKVKPTAPAKNLFAQGDSNKKNKKQPEKNQ
jgi:cell division protein FtsI (penicillin-binding protein 3)